MANNIYIGMRYVPIYVGDYDSETVYEPLSIVAYNGASYTSKQSVPAGILPTNTTYWAKSSDFNAQYSELDGRITEAQDTADAAKEATDYKLQKKLLSDCRFVFVGDSYAEGYNSTDGSVPANGWVNQIKTMLGLSNNQCYSSYAGGAGFAAERPGGGYAAMLTALASRVTDPETIDYVVCCGGHNDTESNTAHIYTGMAAFYTAAHAAFPNAKIMFGMIAWDRRWDVQNSIINVLRFYHQGNINNAPKMGYLAGVEHSLYNVLEYIDVDNIHPTAAGNKSIALSIINALNTGYASNYGPVFNATMALATGWSMSSGSVPTIAARFADGNISFAIQKMDITRGGKNVLDVSGNGGQIEIGTITGLIRGGNVSDIREWKSITVLVRDITSGTAKYYYIPANIGFSGNKLYVNIYKLLDDGSNWQTMHINQIIIPQMNFDYNMFT